MRRTARLWKHSFRNLLLLTGLIFLLPDDRLPAQSCGWVSLPRMRNIITSELEIGPGNYAACYPYSGDFRKQYFVPGSRGHAYRLTFYPELYYGNYLNEYCNLGDLASFFVYRYNQNGTSSTIYNSGQLLFYPGNIYDPLCFSGGFNYPTPRQVIVHGEDIIEVAYVSSGCILEQDPGIGFFDASIECLQGGPISDISFDQPALPKFEEEQDYVLAQMTVPDDFLSPWWRLTVPNGCVLDPVAPGVDIGITVYAGAAAASGLPCTLECYEALSYSGGNQPLDWTYGISQSKFSRPITVLPAPHAQYSGIPYAGGVGNHHQIVLSVTSPAVFNAIQWQFVGDPQGCTLVYHPIDPKKAILTIGSIPAAGNLPVRIYLNALDSVSGYHKQGYVDIQPPPEIGLFKELGVGRNVQAGVTDPGAFGPNFLWFIDNRNPGNMDCSVEASGIVHAGTKVGTFNLHLRDTDSGYEIVGNFTILPAPTFALFTWDSQFSYPRSLIAGHNEWIPLIQVSGANMNMPVAVFESNPVGCQIRVEHILPAELNSGAVGANGGLIKLHIEDDDGYWVEQDFVVRRVPTLTYNDLNPVRAWGSAYSPTVTGDFLGGIQYDIHTAPHGYPNSGGTVPTASVIRSSGLFSAGSQDSYNLPFWTDVIAYDPTVVDYSA